MPLSKVREVPVQMLIADERSWDEHRLWSLRSTRPGDKSQWDGIGRSRTADESCARSGRFSGRLRPGIGRLEGDPSGAAQVVEPLMVGPERPLRGSPAGPTPRGDLTDRETFWPPCTSARQRGDLRLRLRCQQRMDFSGDDPPLDHERHAGQEPGSTHDDDPDDVEPRLEGEDADGDQVDDVEIAMGDPEDLDFELAVPGEDLDSGEHEKRDDE